MIVEIIINILGSLTRLGGFYYNLTEDIIILSLVLHVDEAILLDTNPMTKFQSVGGFNFTVISFYMIVVLVSSQLVIYIYHKINDMPHL